MHRVYQISWQICIPKLCQFTLPRFLVVDVVASKYQLAMIFQQVRKPCSWENHWIVNPFFQQLGFFSVLGSQPYGYEEAR